MINLRHFLALPAVLLAGLTFHAQVEVDKKINMTGSQDSDRAITNLSAPVNGTDAVNKDYVDGAVSAGGSGGGFEHAIGNTYEGGVVVVVHKDENGDEHGLLISLTDVVAARQWGLYGTSVGSTNHWDGSSNTTAIVGVSAATAAGDCKNYTGGGHSDWYLPSITEYKTMYYNIAEINAGLLITSGAEPLDQVISTVYWSSSEFSAYDARCFVFSNGSASGYGKNNAYRVRCLRAF